MSIHDELPVVCKPDDQERLGGIVHETLDKQCEVVPLLALDWAFDLTSWADLKSAKPETHKMIQCGFQG